MKVVVGGSRYQQDKAFVFQIMDRLHKHFRFTRVATGGCRGTDLLVDEWAKSRGIEAIIHEAEWGKFGRSAGPRRNVSMLKAEQPDVVVGFPGGAGTRDLLKRAKAWKERTIEIVEVGRHLAGK